MFTDTEIRADAEHKRRLRVPFKVPALDLCSHRRLVVATTKEITLSVVSGVAHQIEEDDYLVIICMECTRQWNIDQLSETMRALLKEYL